MMKDSLALAIDGGHSMFKVKAALRSESTKRISVMIPTVVTPAISLTDDKTRKKAESDTVHYGGRNFFVGDTALRQGHTNVYTGQTGDWISTTAHDVLILAAWNKVMQAISERPQRIHLVMGLPAKYHASQRGVLRERVKALLAPHLEPEQTITVSIQNQADAPLQWLSIHDDGSPNRARNLDAETWGVVEIGHFTTDFSLSDRGSVIEHANVSCSGVSMVFNSVAAALAAEKIPTTIDVVDQVIRTKAVTWYGKKRDLSQLVDDATAGLEAIILDEADRLFSSQAGIMDGIVVGGGGANLMFKKLRETFPTAVFGDDPRSIVAEGFCRLALLSLSR